MVNLTSDTILRPVLEAESESDQGIACPKYIDSNLTCPSLQSRVPDLTAHTEFTLSHPKSSVIDDKNLVSYSPAATMSSFSEKVELIPNLGQKIRRVS